MLLALSCVGELGRRNLLPPDTTDMDDLRASVLQILLESTAEESKMTAAVSLGAIYSADNDKLSSMLPPMSKIHDASRAASQRKKEFSSRPTRPPFL